MDTVFSRRSIFGWSVSIHGKIYIGCSFRKANLDVADERFIKKEESKLEVLPIKTNQIILSLCLYYKKQAGGNWLVAVGNTPTIFPKNSTSQKCSLNINWYLD